MADQPVVGSGMDLFPASRAYTALVAASPDEQQPRDAVALEVLAQVYLSPDDARRLFGGNFMSSLDDETLRQNMLRGVEGATNNPDPRVAKYARIIEELLKNDPERLRKLLVPVPEIVAVCNLDEVELN